MKNISRTNVDLAGYASRSGWLTRVLQLELCSVIAELPLPCVGKERQRRSLRRIRQRPLSIRFHRCRRCTVWES